MRFIMSKRPNNGEGGPSKRPKTDFDDLWGDDFDLDENVIDDCFKLATQAIEQKGITCTQLNNVSILPTYNSAFNGQRKLFSSTQSSPNLNNHVRTDSNAAFSTRLTRNNSLPTEVRKSNEYEGNLKKLQEQLSAKSGEVAILRNQLKETKARLETENTRKQKDLLEKVNEKNKEMKMVQSKLQFKDLEIIGLKQKISELTKAFNTTISLTVNQTQQKIELKENLEEDEQPSTSIEKPTNYNQLERVVVKYCPLQRIIPPCIFNVVSKLEGYCIRKNRSTENTIVLFHRPYSEHNKQGKETEYLTYSTRVNLSSIFPELAVLLESTTIELEMERSKPIQKIFHVCFALLSTLFNFLKQIKEKKRNKDIINADDEYLTEDAAPVSEVPLFDARKMRINEVGVGVRQSITLIAELLPYSTRLRDYLNEMLTIDSGCVPFVSKFTGRYLEMLLECVSCIGQLRMSCVCFGVLCAVSRLVANLEKYCYDRYSEFVNSLFTEIVLSRPEINALYELSNLLKSASTNAVFIENLCTMQPQNAMQINEKGYYTYNQGICLFHIISVLYENEMDNCNGEFLLRMSANFLSFMLNAFAHNPQWLCPNEEESCECIDRMISVSLEFMICSLDDCRESKYKNDSLYSQVFMLGAKLLLVMHFQKYTLIEKYITSYPKFVASAKRLYECKYAKEWDEELIKDLEQLVLIGEEDENVNLEPEIFNNMCLWNNV